jgi:hypothetical protein
VAKGSTGWWARARRSRAFGTTRRAERSPEGGASTAGRGATRKCGGHPPKALVLRLRLISVTDGPHRVRML